MAGRIRLARGNLCAADLEAPALQCKPRDDRVVSDHIHGERLSLRKDLAEKQGVGAEEHGQPKMIDVPPSALRAGMLAEL